MNRPRPTITEMAKTYCRHEDVDFVACFYRDSVNRIYIVYEDRYFHMYVKPYTYDYLYDYYRRELHEE